MNSEGFEGKFVIPEELRVGNTFSGFRVVASHNRENAHVWVFERTNHAFVVPISYDDYFTLLSNPHERDRILDQLAIQLHQEYRERSILSTTQSNK